MRRILVGLLVILVAGGLYFYFSFPPYVADTDYKIRPASVSHTNTLPFDNGAFYGHSPWSGAHRDSRNSDHIPLPSPNRMKRVWTGLKSDTFFMPPTLGANGRIYATTAGGPGHSHLHAYDKGGNLQWSSAPMESAADLDSAAFFSAPVIDIDDNIFVPDSNQLWSFDPNGSVRWVTDLEALGIDGYVFSVWFSHTGHAGIISSDGKVALFDRATGDLALPILDLPGVAGVPSKPTPPGLLQGVKLDPSIHQDNWDAIWGFNMEVANTPSVHPETGRVFIVATGRTQEQTVLYGIDVTDAGPVIGFETILGDNGSGTSPTISFDGSYVYIIDGEGHLAALETDSGNIAWRSKEKSVTGVSSATEPGGRVFTFQFNEVICRDGNTGEVLWKVDLDNLAPERVGWLPSQYGRPQADVVSGITTTTDGIWFIMKVGSEIPLPEDRQNQVQPPVAGLPTDTFKQPTGHYLVHFDYEGGLVSITDFVDDGALIVMGFDGRMYITTLSITTSIAYYGANPNMPFFMRNTPKPYGGMIAYEPESFLGYLEERVRWTRKLMERWDYGPAEEKARNRMLAEISLSTLHLILQEALARGEVPDNIKDPLQIKLKSAQENGFANLRETNSNLIDMSVWLRDRSYIAPSDK